MEFPSLGDHCTETTCNQLDFLPMKCDACQKIFCRDHFAYDDHKCPASYKKDVQVPVCPLCSQPVPVNRGELPDRKVGEHIDRDCQSDPAREKRKAYVNKCSRKGCKQKELVPLQCATCRKNFCFKHRHEADHDCKGFQGTGRGITSAGAAALARMTKSPASAAAGGVNGGGGGVSGGGGGVSGRGGGTSLPTPRTGNPPPQPAAAGSDAERRRLQEEEDRQLAEAIAASEQEARSAQTTGRRQRQQQRQVCAQS